jgi:hypothetical protein
MQISVHPPTDKGVTTLMYLSDDDAVEKATASPSPLKAAAVMAGAAYIGRYVAGRTGAIAGVAGAAYYLFVRKHG